MHQIEIDWVAGEVYDKFKLSGKEWWSFGLHLSLVLIPYAIYIDIFSHGQRNQGRPNVVIPDCYRKGELFLEIIEVVVPLLSPWYHGIQCWSYMIISYLVVLQSVYQWIVKPQTVIKTNEMFLPGRMAFIFNMVGELLLFGPLLHSFS